MNINVIVRCRPCTESISGKNKPTIKLGSKEVFIQQPRIHTNKSFSFDRIYSHNATQGDVFHQSIKPMVNEVLLGYNATIFAYGQTSTGKTYTMEGKTDSKGKLINGTEGIIPNSINHIFNVLESNKSVYTMKVSCIELYNEELTDLLCNTRVHPRLRIYSENNQTFVQGVCEVTVKNIRSVLELMEQVNQKRHNAETILNKSSSRSHVITTITVFITEKKVNGEEYVKTGKLNLVDLAGSENIRRSGTISNQKRSREAGNINQSLLTLGRVITALCENRSHIPYRESKLTRLLQDSLGGKQKTCLIATITLASKFVEETIRTLEYAHLAKKIENSPEINIKISQGRMLKEISEQLQDVRNELKIQRNKEGVYISKENHDTLVSSKERLAEVEIQIGNYMDELEKLKEEHRKLTDQNTKTTFELKKTKTKMNAYKNEVGKLNGYVDVYKNNEEKLLGNLSFFQDNLVNSEKDIDVYSQIVKNNDSQSKQNYANLKKYESRINNNNNNINNHMNQFVSNQNQFHEQVKRKFIELKMMKNDEIDVLKNSNLEFLNAFQNTLKHINELANSFSFSNSNDIVEMERKHQEFQETSDNLLENLKNKVIQINELHHNHVMKQNQELDAFHDILVNDIIDDQQTTLNAFIKQQSDIVVGLENEIENRKNENIRLFQNQMNKINESMDEMKTKMIKSITDSCLKTNESLQQINTGYGQFSNDIATRNDGYNEMSKTNIGILKQTVGDSEKLISDFSVDVLKSTNDLESNVFGYNSSHNELMKDHKSNNDNFISQFDTEVAEKEKYSEDKSRQNANNIDSMNSKLDEVFDQNDMYVQQNAEFGGEFQKKMNEYNKISKSKLNTFVKKYKKGGDDDVPPRKHIVYPKFVNTVSYQEFLRTYKNAESPIDDKTSVLKGVDCNNYKRKRLYSESRLHDEEVGQKNKKKKRKVSKSLQKENMLY